MSRTDVERRHKSVSFASILEDFRRRIWLVADSPVVEPVCGVYGGGPFMNTVRVNRSYECDIYSFVMMAHFTLADGTMLQACWFVRFVLCLDTSASLQGII